MDFFKVINCIWRPQILDTHNAFVRKILDINISQIIKVVIRFLDTIPRYLRRVPTLSRMSPHHPLHLTVLPPPPRPPLPRRQLKKSQFPRPRNQRQKPKRLQLSHHHQNPIKIRLLKRFYLSQDPC